MITIIMVARTGSGCKHIYAAIAAAPRAMSVYLPLLARHRSYRVRVVLFTAILAGFEFGPPSTSVQAADAIPVQPTVQLPLKTPVQTLPGFNWVGLYVGGHVGYSRGA